MPTYSFNPNQGEVSNLSAQDRLRQANADRMIQMTLANMQAQQNAADSSSRERMFNRQMDADATRALAQERMFEQELGFRKDEGAAGRDFQKELFTLGEDAANRRFQTNRQATKEDYDYFNPEASYKRKAINEALNPQAQTQGKNYEQLDALGLNYLIPTNEKANLAYNKYKAQKELEDRYATEQGLPTSADVTRSNMKRTEASRKVEDIRGNPELDAAIAASPEAQSAIRAIKIATESKDPDAIGEAGYTAFRTLTGKGMSSSAAQKLISDYSKKYKDRVSMSFMDFLKYPITAPLGLSGSARQSKDALDQFIIQGLE